MRCTECEAQLSPGVEFCPQCGTPTSQGLRERRAVTQAEDELKAKRRGFFLIGAAFVFGLVIGNQTGWWSSDFNFEDHDSDRRPAIVGVQQLFDAYRDDEDDADDRFGNRNLIVAGEFVEVRNDDNGNPDLRLKTSDPQAPLGADIVESSHDEARRLQPGQMVTLSCRRMSETGEEHWLQDCSIEIAGPVPAQRGPAETPAPAAASETAK